MTPVNGGDRRPMRGPMRRPTCNVPPGGGTGIQETGGRARWRMSAGSRYLEELSEEELPEPYLVPGIVLLDPLELLPLPVPVVLSVVLGLLGDMLPLVPDAPELVSGLLGEVVLPDVLPPLPMSLWLPLPDMLPEVPDAPEPDEVSGLGEVMLPGVVVEELPLVPLVPLVPLLLLSQLALDPEVPLLPLEPGGQSAELPLVPVVAEEPLLPVSLLPDVPLAPELLLPLVPLAPLLSLPMLLPLPPVPDGLAVAPLEP